MPEVRYVCSICGYSYGETTEGSLQEAEKCEEKGLDEEPVCKVGDTVEISGIKKEVAKIVRIYPERVSHKLCYSYFSSTHKRWVYVYRNCIVGKIVPFSA